VHRTWLVRGKVAIIRPKRAYQCTHKWGMVHSMDEAGTRPEWLIWLLDFSDEWVYVVFRIISLVIGLVLFIWGMIKAFIVFFARSGTSRTIIGTIIGKTRAFFVASAIGFAGAAFGWGWPMYIAMKYHLTNCEGDMLVIGRTWVEGKCPGYPTFSDW